MSWGWYSGLGSFGWDEIGSVVLWFGGLVVRWFGGSVELPHGTRTTKPPSYKAIRLPAHFE